MKVTLIYATPNAIDLLIFTKSTRLAMSPNLLADISSWPIEKKMEELEYMSRTIPSSWEFVDLIFCIEGVSRGFTHQFVRTRTASFAQQSMRVVDMTGFDYYTGPTINDPISKTVYEDAMEFISQRYKELVTIGAAPEDARGVLPTNIHTNIVAKFNLRSFADLVKARKDGRVQDEYGQVLKGMIDETLKEWPWAKMFIMPKHNEAFDKLTKYLKEQMNDEVRTSGVSMNKTEAWTMLKELNLIRQENK